MSPTLTISVSLILLTFLVALWYFYYKYCFTYWTRKKIPTINPQFPFGNITKSVLGQESLFYSIETLHREFKSRGEKHGGIYFFNGPCYLPIDVDLIKSILVTDFEHFVDRGTFIDEAKYPLGAHIFSMTGSEWKTLRNKLSPVYTSGKIKSMFATIRTVADNFVKNLEIDAENSAEINLKRRTEQYTADIICTTAFGVNCNITENSEHELMKILRRMINPPKVHFIIKVLAEGFQNPGNILKAIVSDRTVEHFFKGFLETVVSINKSNNFKDNNLFNSLLKIRDEGGINDNEILGETFLFFLAGFETSSATISYSIHEMAHNQSIQEKLRQEILDNLGADCSKFTYEGVYNLPYLDKVFKETLRKYPVLGMLNRICVKDYKIPHTDIILEKGTPVIISTLGLQLDPEHFPNPLKFDPERWNDGDLNKDFKFMPFGEGPRFCIGMRFGKLQTKMGIAALISKYRFLPSEITPKDVKYDKLSTTLAMSPKNGISVKIVKI